MGPNQAVANLRKHGVRFAEAVTIFEDDGSLTMPDDDLTEERFISVGLGSLGRVLVVVYTPSGRPRQDHNRAKSHPSRALSIRG